MLHLAIAQFRPRKGAYRENLRRFGAMLAEAAGLDEPPGLVIGAETALTGYFVEGAVRELALPAEQLFADLSEEHGRLALPPVDVSLGFYELYDNRLCNAALYASLGGPDAGIRHVHRKIFLPTYGVFDEERFVEPGRGVEAFDTRWGRAAMIICEDAWHAIVPTIAALDGAQLLIVPSASPARGIQPDGDPDRPASLARWERIMQGIAGEHGIYVALAQLVGFEGGKAFPGGSLIAAPDGTVTARGPLFEDALVSGTVDLRELVRARADSPLLSDLETRLPHLVGSLHRAMAGETAGARPPATRTLPASAPAIGARFSADPLAIEPELTERWLVEFVRDELVRRRGFPKAVLGLSGGVDSAVVAYLAARALGPENVVAVRMPYRTSSGESLAHAELVTKALGIEMRTVDITAAVDGLAGALGDAPGPARLGNIMARTRMITLFDLSAAVQALPLGTGNKTERLLGYFTWHADDAPPVNPLGDLFKTQVWALARQLGVPEVIIDKPASADLIQGQTDEGDIGVSYQNADLILHWLLLGYSPEEIASHGFTAGDIATIRARLDSTHWKRKLPTVAMLSQTAIGEYYLRPVDY